MEKKIKKTPKTIHEERYDRLIKALVTLRKEKGFTQRTFAKTLGVSNCFVARTEIKERRLDLIEAIDYMRCLGMTTDEILTVLTDIVGE